MFVLWSDLVAEPTSAPLNVTVEDVNDTTLTIKWRSPEVLGDSGLDGYTVEYCKDGGELRFNTPPNLVLCVAVSVRGTVCAGLSVCVFALAYGLQDRKSVV